MQKKKFSLESGFDFTKLLCLKIKSKKMHNCKSKYLNERSQAITIHIFLPTPTVWNTWDDEKNNESRWMDLFSQCFAISLMLIVVFE